MKSRSTATLSSCTRTGTDVLPWPCCSVQDARSSRVVLFYEVEKRIGARRDRQLRAQRLAMSLRTDARPYPRDVLSSDFAKRRLSHATHVLHHEAAVIEGGKQRGCTPFLGFRHSQVSCCAMMSIPPNVLLADFASMFHEVHRQIFFHIEVPFLTRFATSSRHRLASSEPHALTTSLKPLPPADHCSRYDGGPH